MIIQVLVRFHFDLSMLQHLRFLSILVGLNSCAILSLLQNNWRSGMDILRLYRLVKIRWLLASARFGWF